MIMYVKSLEISSTRNPQKRYLTCAGWIAMQTHKSQMTGGERCLRAGHPRMFKSNGNTRAIKHATAVRSVNPLKSTLGKALIPELWTDAVTTSTSFRTNNSRPRVSCSASNQHHLKDLKYHGAPRDGAAGWLEGLINVTRRTPCNREDKRQK